MSSSITESLVHEGKLLVHISENGHSFELDCNENTPVESVMQFIESAAGINFNDQLVLCLDMKLEPQKLISAYRLPADDKEVFVFNKLRLQSNLPPPPPEQVDVLEVADPPPPALSQDPHPLDDASDPALKALPSYERQFRYHYHRGNAIYLRTQAKIDICERLLREQKVQERALEIGRGNLEQYYRVINQNYNEFMKRYSQQHSIHSDLLANLGRDIEKLRSIKLHPSLQTATRNCLMDFMKEYNLPKSSENCSSSHRRFENKVSQFKQIFDDVKRKVEELLNTRASFSMKNLEVMIKEHQRFINEQKSIMQSLSKDVSIVKKLVDDCLSCQLSSSLRPHDAVSALGPMYDVHEKNHLPKMQACDHSISKLLDFCQDKKNEMNVFVHYYMQKITCVSRIIKDTKYQFPVFREAMMRQDDIFADLKLVRWIDHAYRACLAEVVRRKAFMKLYMGMAGQLAERLATKREVEVKRRREFLEANSALPRDILASLGLCDTPNQCDVYIASFDTNLLDIDISDLEGYVPEYLAGFRKGEKPVNVRGSFSMSCDSSYSAEAEEIALNVVDKDNPEELLEGCEFVEIAGTSKMEVENAKLKAELASAIALICSLCPEMEYEPLDDSKLDSILKNTADKTAEALHLKDEYGKHLQAILKAKQLQCVSYEKRIQELEQRLSDQYLQGQKHSSSKDVSDCTLLVENADDCKPETSGGGETYMPCISTSEPMDEVSCVTNSFDAKLGLLNRQPSKGREGVDENMMDSAGMLNPQLNSSMMECYREELPVSDKDGKDKMPRLLGMSMTNSSTAESVPEPHNVLPCDAAVDLGLDPKVSSDLVSELRSALADKSNQLTETQTKLKAAMDEAVMLGRELEMIRKLLESQMNCAHLENCLHEPREEAQTHLCAADRRASEYSALHASAVKMCGLFERLHNCVFSPGGVTGFADSLCALAQSLANSINDNEDDGTAEVRKCIGVLADRVDFLSKHREELLDTNRKVEVANEQLKKELEEKKELVKTLYTKHQLEIEKQTNKEKISFGRLEVHEIAAFVLNSAGHYEAINRNCSNYYLSAESVALFTDNLPIRPSYIVGQIVHVECQTVKPLPPAATRPEHGKADQMDHLTSDPVTDRSTTSNPYGCEYFLVTVAMLPDTSIHSPPPS